jgi:putative multiple sugar transport system substrate-binding protein
MIYRICRCVIIGKSTGRTVPMNKTIKKLAALLLTAAILLSLAACSPETRAAPASKRGGGGGESGSGGEEAQTIGVSLPSESDPRWSLGGSSIRTALEADGYTVDLRYGGDNEIPMQIGQLEDMLESGCDLLVVAAIDGDSLTEVLGAAKEKGVPVIAYDVLIMGTDAVTGYAAFDNWKTGVLQGEYIRRALDLDNAEGPFHIEFFTGDPGDGDIGFFFGGAMEVLGPYLDSGVLVCPSGQTNIAQAATLDGDPELARTRMEELIASHGYGPGQTRLDAVLCAGGSAARGVVLALTDAGYDSDNIPVVTGQDCDIESVKNMLAGLQAMSVFQDPRTLAGKAAEMAAAILSGGEPPVNATETHDNGAGVVPSFLCGPTEVTIGNYRELLIDSGYYTEDELR